MKSELRRETGLVIRTTNVRDFYSSVPPVVLAKSACAERLSVGERERERVVEEKKRSMKFEDGVVLYFFLFLSVDYRNYPQWIFFGYRPLIFLLFCWL